MSTQDCPGYGTASNDKLAPRCWAEHKDGSLVYIKDVTENDVVIFELFELKDKAHPLSYSHAMAKKDFEKQFSYDPNKTGKANLRWTWHDKTPMPWDLVMKYIDSPIPQHTNVVDTLSAAAKMAESLKARAGVAVTKDDVYQQQGVVSRDSTDRAKGIWSRLKHAMGKLS